MPTLGIDCELAWMIIAATSAACDLLLFKMLIMLANKINK